MGCVFLSVFLVFEASKNMNFSQASLKSTKNSILYKISKLKKDCTLLGINLNIEGSNLSLPMNANQRKTISSEEKISVFAFLYTHS